MKKFYRMVSTHQDDQGFTVQLDGKTVKTPAQKPLLSVTESLAQQIAKEWQEQGDEIVPDTMPLTQFLTRRYRLNIERWLQFTTTDPGTICQKK